jgi:hypothetical protein
MRLRRATGRVSRSGASHAYRLPLAVAIVGSVAALCAAGRSAAEVRIVGADEVLDRFCSRQGGRLYLTLPGLLPQELITSTTDAAVANPGDGEFHPLDRGAVEDALAALDFPVDRVDAAVYVLPYPRRAGLGSAASHGAILLAPGTVPVPAATVHAIVAHEFGHVVQRALAPTGSPAWSDYLRLRGLSVDGADAEGVWSEAPHADRPAEIFAEDFRTLLGGALARGDGTVENTSLLAPTDVTGLAAFLADLPERARRTAMTGAFASGRSIAAFPNPFHHAVTLSAAPALALGALPPARTIQVLDVRGRVVRRESVPVSGDGSITWRWDGHDDAGVRLPAGSYFVNAEGESGRATRIVLVR